MSETQVYVLSIHDRSLNGGYLAFDLKDVLESLAGLVLQSSWCVLELDAFGDNVEPFCRSVEARMGRGIWVSGEDLIDLSKRIEQTIDGQFLAFH
ncbi:MAG TPA: hypothetical protein VFM05_08745 [Candidatus Saccharimonadales bacterium]|nr:hypothetical protein [Candidatus Saccharimonadales bacterium]